MHPWVSARHNFVIKASDRSKDPVCLLAWSGTWHWGFGGSRVTRWGLSIYLHLSTKTAPSWGWRSLYLTWFHPRMTHLSLDSLILISLFPFYARLPLFDSPCLGEFGRSSCSHWDPHRLRQKQRDNPLCTVDTQTQQKKTPPSEEKHTETHTPTKSNK